MEIKNVNSRMINAYKSVSGTPPKGKNASSAAGKTGGENFDKVEFNFGLSLSAAQTDITASVNADANTERLEQLQAAYEGDSLPVTPEQIAGTIVG
ncbi:MAG: hypothetical protein LBC82_04880 [Oscillospiraceae bacterium]|jgi:anti-sigma28 factor (negative regulator of flagellin synthesis)|nr:hypothetical protein [Oscillospiraceae bacterium]